MSELLEPAAVYRALLEVQEGADPAEVYAGLMEDAIDPEEARAEMFLDDVENAHDHDDCRDKNMRGSFCYGTTCIYVGNVRMQVDCPCECHKWENEPELTGEELIDAVQETRRANDCDAHRKGEN